MSSIEIIRLCLGISAGIVVLIAIIAFIVIFLKIKKKKQEIALDQIRINQELSLKESEKKMMERKDLGEPLVNLQQVLGQTINHEIVEFCINSCIRNEYKKVLLLGDVEPYEAITISNKANSEIYIKKEDFDETKYLEIKNKIDLVKHDIKLLNKIEKEKFDSIMVLNSFKDFDNLFLQNEKYLIKNGMFIFANTKSNKKSLKKLIKNLEEYNYRYDILKWYTGFVTAVK